MHDMGEMYVEKIKNIVKAIQSTLQELKGPFLLTWPYIKKYKYHHLVILFFMISSIFVSLASAWVYGNITDAAVSGNLNKVLSLIPLGFGLTIFTICSSYVNTLIQARLTNGVMRDFKLHVFHHILRLPASKTANTHTGEYLAHITSNVSGIMGFMGSSLISFIQYPVMFLAAFVYVMQLNGKLAVVIAFGGPAILAVSTIYGRYIKKNSRRSIEIYTKTNKLLTETFSGWSIIRAFTLEKQVFHKYKDQSDKTYDLAIENTKLSAKYSIANSIVSSIGSIIIMGGGAYLVATKKITIGELMIFTRLIGYLVSPITGIAGLWTGLQGSLASLEKIQALLNTEVDSPQLADIKEEKIEIRSLALRDISFRYNEEKEVFQQLNVQIPAGKIVALVGPSGAGKSTLFNLLLGFYRPQKGSIYINEDDAAAMDVATWRNAISYVPQESFLFADTIRENLMMVKPTATKEEMIAAAKDANIHEFIMSLPEGYDTELGERGVRLSGGQRQRVSIARAILKDAPILLLDEATSALDSETEQLVQQALERLMEGRTTLIIAHRLSTIQNADEILVMDNGQIIESGTHPQLLKRKGHYYRMHQTQFGKATQEQSA